MNEINEILARLFIVRTLKTDAADELTSAKQAFNEETHELNYRVRTLRDREIEVIDQLREISESLKYEASFPLQTRRQTYLEVYDTDLLVDFCLNNFPQALRVDTGRLDEIVQVLIDQHLDHFLTVDFSEVESALRNGAIPTPDEDDIAEIKTDIVVPVPRTTLEKFVDEDIMKSVFEDEIRIVQEALEEEENGEDQDTEEH